ncbi:YcxB family protein [Bacteroidales bacterium OttesenSCG-928-M06]|nr:YcxB family protein [Bacteroidales bacterium OttesenSCG-928-M06]
MKIAYNLTVEDWVDFQEYYMKKKAPLSGCMTPILTILMICNIIIGIYMEFIAKTGSYNFVFLICIIILGYLLYLKTKTRKKLFKSGEEIKEKNPGAFGEMTMDFQDEGIDIHSKTHSKFLVWEEISSYDNKSKVFFLLYSKKGMVYIIPKRDIESETELQAVLENHLSKN